MKTLEQIQKEIPYGHIFYTVDFKFEADCGNFIDYDGDGFFHDGIEETDISVWSADYKDWEKYPYVVWYNR